MIINPKKIITSSGKDILIFDNIYDLPERIYFYRFAINSKYTPLSRDDSDSIETRGDFNLVSNFSEDDLMSLKFWSNDSSKQLEKYFYGYKIGQIRVNLSTLNDNNRIHIDNVSPCKTLIYYLNLEWKIEWGGALLITNDDKTEIDNAIAYRPGRIIIMDGTIPHCIAAPTNLAPTYRFSLAIQYYLE